LLFFFSHSLQTASTSTDHSSPSAPSADADNPPAKQKRLLRSSIGLPPSVERPNVLPKLCVICRRNKYVRKGYGKSRALEGLRQCELIDGGQLTEAAEKKNDEVLLTLIKGKDCVAIEVMYHASCHRDYTRFLSIPPPSGSVTNTKYMEAFAKEM